MLTDAHSFIDLTISLYGQDVLTPSQQSGLSAYTRQGFPTIRPEAFKALRCVLRLRQIDIKDFAQKFNAVMRAYRKGEAGDTPPPGASGPNQLAIENNAKGKPNREGALQGKSRIFPSGESR